MPRRRRHAALAAAAVLGGLAVLPAARAQEAAGSASAAPRGGASFATPLRVDPTGTAILPGTTPGALGSEAPGLPAPPVRLGAGGFGAFGGGFGLPAPLARGLERGFETSGSLSGRVIATDNARSTVIGRERGDVLFQAIPSFTARGETGRFVGSLNYTPIGQLSVNNSDRNRIDQRLFAVGSLQIVPGRVFLDARASAGFTPFGGNLGAQQAAQGAFGRRDVVQNYNVVVSPYIVQRFGGWADGILGYTYQYGESGGRTFRGLPGGLPIFAPQEFSSHSAVAGLRTGEDFGRLAGQARARGELIEGTGVLSGAHRHELSTDLAYAITRTIRVLGEVGYEDQKFGGTPRVRIQGPIWAAGARLDLSPESFVVVRYQRRDGFESPFVLGRTALGANTILSVDYSEGLTTFARRSGDILLNAGVDRLGNPIVASTGAPATDLLTGGLGAPQAGLFRNRRGSAQATHLRGLNTFTLRYSRDEREPRAVQAGTQAFRQTIDAVALIWSRPVTPQTAVSAVGQVTFSESAFAGAPGIIAATNTSTTRGEFFFFSATLSHQFSDRVSGFLQYQFTNSSTSLASAAAGLPPGTILPGQRTDRVANAIVAQLTTRLW